MESEITLKEKKDLRLLVDAHVFDGMFQGTRTFLKGIYSTLDTAKYNITVFLVAANIKNLKDEFSGIPNIEFIRLRSTNKFVRLAYEIPKIIRKLNIDYAHFNYYLPLFLNKNCKFIVTIHDVLFLDYPNYFPKSYYFKNKILFRHAAKKADILTSVSNYAADRIKNKFNLPDKAITILPNAVDQEFKIYEDKKVSQHYIKEKYGISNFFVYVSRIEPRKNHIALLEMYEKLSLWNRNIQLVFIGKMDIEDESFIAKYNSLVKKSNGRVFHLTGIGFKDLKSFYNAALVAFFPSLCEGFGIPPLESAVMKTPTICSNLTAMEEFNFFGKYHIDPRDKNIFNRKVMSMLEEIGEGNQQSSLSNISSAIINKYDWNKTSEILAQTIILHSNQKST